MSCMIRQQKNAHFSWVNIIERSCDPLQLKYEASELEELREMKADIERRDKAQALLIENQAKRLDELETLYKVTNHQC